LNPEPLENLPALWHTQCMSDQADKKKQRKRPRDPNQLAASIVAEATEEETEELAEDEDVEEPADDGKNPAAVALGRLGGKKGGPARAKALSKERRQEIARNAAEARWKVNNTSDSGEEEKE
jgi:hypothetical protein